MATYVRFAVTFKLGWMDAFQIGIGASGAQTIPHQRYLCLIALVDDKAASPRSAPPSVATISRVSTPLPLSP